MRLREQLRILKEEVAGLDCLYKLAISELSEFRKWKNSLDWNKDVVKRLEYLIRDYDKQLQCFHDWRYMHMHDNMAIFFCERCGGIQRRKWQDLTEKEKEGLALLGIHEPEQKAGKGTVK